MSDTSRNGTKQVLQFILDKEPVEQDRIVDEFGRNGLSVVRRLIDKKKVTYSIDWKLVIDGRGFDTNTDQMEGGTDE